MTVILSRVDSACRRALKELHLRRSSGEPMGALGGGREFFRGLRGNEIMSWYWLEPDGRLFPECPEREVRDPGKEPVPNQSDGALWIRHTRCASIAGS